MTEVQGYRVSNGNSVSLVSYKFVNKSLFPDVGNDILELTDVEEVNNVFGDPIVKVIKDNLPNCITWEYSETNLLPGRIDIASFKANPSICVPLKSMFNLAGITDINKVITEQEGRTNGIRNLFAKVADNATKHIRSIWKERSDIEVYLAQNGPIMEAGIKDSFNVYDFSRRSEGFKRFITFLLLISAPDRNLDLENSLILIDEPDLGLHPSGVKCLKNELQNISKRNFVVICTHSIFMIDREKIDMHLIASKENEVTTIKVAPTSKLIDEEVLYNALGASLFEILKHQNILFEGWRDKTFFKKAISKSKRKDFDFGFCHANGVKDIDAKAGLIELAGREFIIISDADEPAMEKQRVSGYKKKWHTYFDIFGEGYESYEDFIDKAFVLKCTKEVLSLEHIDVASNITLSDSPVINQIKSLLGRSRVSKDQQKDIMNKIKERIIEGLKPKDIQDKYFEIFDWILKKTDKDSHEAENEGDD
jgi:hypothetical protein